MKAIFYLSWKSPDGKERFAVDRYEVDCEATAARYRQWYLSYGYAVKMKIRE